MYNTNYFNNTIYTDIKYFNNTIYTDIQSVVHKISKINTYNNIKTDKKAVNGI